MRSTSRNAVSTPTLSTGGNMKRQSLLANGITLTLGIFLVIATAALTAFGQAGTSTVRGTVADPQGNVVAGATVTLTSVATNTSRTTTTSDSGSYSFDFVQPGDYRLDVEAKGFKKSVVNDIHALVAKPTPVDVKLEIGNVSETVTVASGSAELLVNRDDASLGNNFVYKQILQLPVNARSVPALLTLQPAVTRTGYVAGARSNQSNVTLDGVDVNEAQTNTLVPVNPTTGNVNDDPTTAQEPANNT